MASKSVEIIIAADDQATQKFQQVEKSMRSTSTAFKESASKAKASTEIVGALATVTAGSSSALSGFAGELAQVTERLSAFSEVSERGGAGALAFKAGIIAAVGAIGFKLGKALGDAIFQTEKLNEQFENTIDLARQLNNELVGTQESRFARDLRDLEAIKSIVLRRQAAQEKQALVDTEIAIKQSLIAKLTEEIAGRTETWSGWAASISGEYAKTTEILQSQLEDEKELLESLRKQSHELSQVATIEDKIAAAAEKAKEEKEKQIEATKKLMEENERFLQAEARAAEARQSQRENFARRYIAEQERAQAIIEKANKDAVREAMTKNATSALSARGGRLLTRGTDEGTPAKIAKNTGDTAKAMETLNQSFEDWVAEQRQKEQAVKELAITLVD